MCPVLSGLGKLDVTGRSGTPSPQGAHCPARTGALGWVGLPAPGCGSGSVRGGSGPGMGWFLAQLLQLPWGRDWLWLQLGDRRWEGIGSGRISSGDLGEEIGSRRSLGNDSGRGLALSAAQLLTWGRGLALRSLSSDLRVGGGGDWLLAAA